MGDFLNSLISLISNRDVKNSRKAIGFIVAIIILIFINDTFGFSRFYYESNRVKILSDISVLLNNGSLNPTVKKQLQSEQLEIAQMQPFYLSLSRHLRSKSKVVRTTETINENTIDVIKSIGFWYYFYSRLNWIILFDLCLFLYTFPGLKTIYSLILLSIIHIICSLILVFILNLLFPVTLFGVRALSLQLAIIILTFFTLEYYKFRHPELATQKIDKTE